MKKEIILNGEKITYDFQYKQVKNINLRIKADGSVHVSASRRVSEEAVEQFLHSRAELIVKTVRKFSQMIKAKQKPYFTEEQLRQYIMEFSLFIYPYFEKRGVRFPQIKFRSMVSRWGSCNSTNKIVTFNTKLIYVPKCVVEYVVIHEFSHFLQPNHSKNFYEEVEKLCPDWKERRKILKTISAR